MQLMLGRTEFSRVANFLTSWAVIIFSASSLLRGVIYRPTIELSCLYIDTQFDWVFLSAFTS
jgi:hypothetical protein